MALLISDSNILIDMISGELLHLMFDLPEIFAVPDILYMEELHEQHSDLPGYGLQVLGIESKYMSEAYRLKPFYRNVGGNDLFALVLAKQEKCPILTGDAKLREIAKSEKVDVYGSIWLIERMIQEKLISVEKANRAFDKMQNDNRRLPWNLAFKMLDRYS